MNTVIRGICKKEIAEIMPVYTDRDDFKEEYKIKVGQETSFSYDHKEKKYEFYLHYKKMCMTREEVMKHFDIVWEYECFNGCIQNGVACKRLASYKGGETSIDKINGAYCRIGWEVGRGTCSGFEAS
ncbi:hypothetical protein PP175_27840 (plasmid) [Aneurinibacillus sp. Ricciae_BoGa-3]|uniref:hypothetical protein n=1 Tax=Aneurinibacillus sp. Ricciae_BoGa-3 TaxID=3022697 RepID=UPI0023403C6F|nr:hypothetical protein [Aneurinibacillus sp. Ricciae_BoGa-3]WCK57005.1 hypothetical protein PP175_27840 [Aneurinibacillus sp. Ricciae_BoGa-3]